VASPADPMLKVNEAAAVLAVSRDTVLRAIKRGDLAAFENGRVIRIRRSELDRFIAANTGKPRSGRSRASRG
jgi:excisionase family DNA binding protein